MNWLNASFPFQIEPYFASLCLYDAKQGRKISEDFFFDVNEPYIRNLLPKNISKNRSRGTTLLPDLMHAPLEWLSYPRQVRHSRKKLENISG